MADGNAFKRGPGRPKKEMVAHDPEAVKEFVEGEYQYYVDKRALQDNHKAFRESYEDRIDEKLIAQTIRAVKLRYAMEKRNASQDTVDAIMEIVDDVFGAVLSAGD